MYVFDMDSTIEADRPIIAQGEKLFLHHIDLESHQRGMKMARCINFLPRNSIVHSKLVKSSSHLVVPHASKLHTATIFQSYLVHGGLYRWRENSLPFFYIRKRDFDLVQQNHFNSFKKLVDFQNLKGVAQKLSPPCPFQT